MKMTILSKAICRFNVIPIKLPMVFFHRIRRKRFTICMETKRPRIAKAIFRKKNRAGGIRLPDFKQYYKAIVIQHATGTETQT